MTDVRLNFYPRVTRTVLFGGKPRVVTVQFAGYSLGGGPLVADVGEAQELGFPVTSRRVTLDLTRADLKTDSDVVAALNLAIDQGAPYTWVKCCRAGCTRERFETPNTNRFEQVKVKRGTGQYGGDHACVLDKPLCEECFMADLDAEWKKSEEKEKAAQARREVKLFAQGFRVAVDVWVHPKRGGDDYQATYYYTTTDHDAARAQAIKSLARVSVRTDDVSKPRDLKPLAAVPAPPARARKTTNAARAR